MRRNYSQPAGSTPYQRRYAGFRGVDFTSNPMNVDPTRSPYAENIIVDSAGVVHKRPRYLTIHSESITENQMHGMAMFQPSSKYYTGATLVTHEGSTLYYNNWTLGHDIHLNDAESQMFQFNGKLYILDGKAYRVFYFDDELDTPAFATKYVYEVATPTETQIAGYWYAEEYTEINESTHEGETKFKYTWTFGERGERNLLTGRRINTFCGDGIHKTFWLDCQNFKVYKVEMYRYIPDQIASTTEATVVIKAHSNIRSEDNTKNDSNIIANTGSTTPTCVTTGRSAHGWYQIMWQNRTAYVAPSRVQSSSGQVSNIATDDKGWEPISASDYTISEDTDKHCTKIVFDSIPPVHPRGNGLPNIRVTGAMTEVAEQTHTYTADEILYEETSLTIEQASMMTEFLGVSKKVDGVWTAMDSSKYTVTLNGDHGATVSFNPTPEVGDEVMLTYRRETFRDIDLIGKCNKYGRYGEYNFDRFFFTGNPDYRNRDWYTEPSDPTIVLENSYTDIGDQSTGIAGYLNFQSDMLIIKYDSNGDNLFRRTASTDGDLTIFPVRAYKGRGVTSDKAIANINGECVFLTPEGVYEFISTDLGSKYSTKEMSYTISKKLLAENLEEGVMTVWGNWLLLSFPTSGHCYVADTTQLTAPSTSGGNGWEWWYWTNCPFTHSVYDAIERTLYVALPEYKVAWLSTNGYETDGYAFADYPDGIDEAPVPYTALWSTFQDYLDDPARYKYVERRGCILHFEPFDQTVQLGIVTDGRNVVMRRDDAIDPDPASANGYDFIELHASAANPNITLDRRISRFQNIQFIFKNDDPDTDGIGLLSLEFQYRFGRYIHH